VLAGVGRTFGDFYNCSNLNAVGAFYTAYACCNLLQHLLMLPSQGGSVTNANRQ
jgi:hypothetical protein